MKPLGGQAENDIARLDGRAGQHLFALHCPDDKTSKIVFSRCVHARHFGGFATNQCAAILFTGASDAADHFPANFRFQPAYREIIQKK